MEAILSRRLWFVLALAAVLYTALACLHTVADPDTGWHLATGRWVLQHHRLPGADVLSYTSQGAVWHYPSFAGVLLYLVYSASGFAGLGIFCAVAGVLLVSALVFRAPSRSLWTPALALLAVPLLVHRLTPRADLFTTVCFGLVLLVLWRYHCDVSPRLWTLPLLFALWVNLHPGYVSGLGLLAAYAGLEVLELLWPSRRLLAWLRLRRALPWLAASFAATLLNPWGWAMLTSAVQLTSTAGHQQGYDFRAHIGEWSSVRLTLPGLMQALRPADPESGYWWLLAAALLAVAVALWRRRLGAALLLAAAAVISVRFLRLQAIFAVVVIIVGGEVLAEGCAGLVASARFARASRALAVAVTVALLALTGLRAADLASDRSYVYSADLQDFGLGESWWYPERAAAFIQREQLPANLFQPFNIGGFVDLRLGPRYLSYLDGRSISGQVMEEAEHLLAAPPDGAEWQRVADARNIQTVFLLTARLGGLSDIRLADFCRSREWAPVYLDEVAFVALRRTPQNQPLIARLQIDCATAPFTAPAGEGRAAQFQFHANAGAVLFALARDAEAGQHWQQAAALFPGDANVHLYLAQLYQQQGQPQTAEQEFRASLRARPTATAAYGLGRLLAGQHRWAEARPLVAQAAALSNQPANQYKALAQVELRLNQPEPALTHLAQAERHGPSAADASPNAAEFRAQLAEGRAEAARQQHQPARAVELQQEAVRQSPLNAARWRKLAELATAAGDTALAGQAAQRVDQLASPPAPVPR